MAMGGGSMMRAAAKVVGIGVVNSGRCGGVVPESPISAAACAAARPIGAIASKSSSSSDSVKASVAIDAPPSVGKPNWGEFEDWEFAGGEDEILNRSGDPQPRLVFGVAPTIEEAKVATAELKDALGAFVSSPRSIGSGYGSLYGTGLSQHSNSEVVENKACLTTVSATPKHAIQAFKFLDQSPEVQGVVASIASDPNVWDAVLQNPALQDYLQSRVATYSNTYQNLGGGDVLYQESPRSFDVFSETGKCDGEVLHQTSPRSFDASSETGKSDSRNQFREDIWKNMKLTVVDMMSSLSDFFSSLFGILGDKNSANTPSLSPVVEKLLGPSILGVVVMVIMVVVLKRV